LKKTKITSIDFGNTFKSSVFKSISHFCIDENLNKLVYLKNLCVVDKMDYQYPFKDAEENEELVLSQAALEIQKKL